MQQGYHRLIYPCSGFVGESPRLSDLLPEERMILAFTQIDRADFGVHPPARDH